MLSPLADLTIINGEVERDDMFFFQVGVVREAEGTVWNLLLRDRNSTVRSEQRHPTFESTSPRLCHPLLLSARGYQATRLQHELACDVDKGRCLALKVVDVAAIVSSIPECRSTSATSGYADVSRPDVIVAHLSRYWVRHASLKPVLARPCRP